MSFVTLDSFRVSIYGLVDLNRPREKTCGLLVVLVALVTLTILVWFFF